MMRSLFRAALTTVVALSLAGTQMGGCGGGNGGPTSASLSVELDPDFGGTGKVTTTVGAAGFGNSIAVQPDGKILVAGSSVGGADYGFTVARYAANGTLDSGFNGSGKVTTDIGGGDDLAYSVALQSDGKIVVAGSATSGPNTSFAVVRYETDGTLDPTFNGSGKVTTAIGNGSDLARSVAVQPDGKIVVAGHSSNGANFDFAVVRYHADGTLDTGFNGSGRVTTNVGGGDDLAYSVALQSDGRIVVAGHASNGANYDFAVVRYQTDGTLDPTFNGSGKVTTAVGGSDDWGQSVAVQSDGKIVVAGLFNNGANRDFAVVRYGAGGTLDTEFDGTGKVTTSIGESDDEGWSVALQSDGRIVVAGDSIIGGGRHLAVVRYRTDGTLDPTFNGSGKVTTSVGEGVEPGSAIALQPDGKIVVAGSCRTLTECSCASVLGFAVVRYKAPSKNPS